MAKVCGNDSRLLLAVAIVCLSLLICHAVSGQSRAVPVQHSVRYTNGLGILGQEPALAVAHQELVETLATLRCSVVTRLKIDIRVGDVKSMNESYVVHGVRADAQSLAEANQAQGSRNASAEYAVELSGEGVLATVYGMFALAERCQLQPCRCGEWARERVEPSFALRTLSEEGQLLDLPDVAYRSDSGPNYLNSDLIVKECDYFIDNVVPRMLKHGFNSLTILHHDVEEYISYVYITDFQVYNQTDPHVYRAIELGMLISNFTNVLHEFHLTVFFQPYEVSCPPVLCSKVDLYAGTVDLQRVLDARYREFFQVTHADGIIVTVSDSWSPRGGYEFHKVWSNASELAMVATAFYNAVVVGNNKQLVFRLWEWHGEGDWDTLVENTPNNLTFSVKITAGDFLLDQPIHPLLQNNSKAPTQKPIMVLVDVFRQYNGWAKTLCYVQQWKDRLQQAWRLGVRQLNVWGAWSPGCTWPDSGPQLINGTKGEFKSWQGLYDDYRVYTTSHDMAFSGGRANAYLIYRLAMDVGGDLQNITNDFATMYFGSENMAAIRDSLLLTQETYLQAQCNPKAVADFVLEWTVVFNPSTAALKQFPVKTSYGELMQVNDKVRSGASQLMSTLAKVNPATVPDPSTWQSFQHAAAITHVHWLSLATWKEVYFLNHTLSHSANATVCRLLQAGLSTWQDLMSTWESTAPQQGEDWQITRVSPKLASRPDFFHGWVSFNDYIVSIEGTFKDRCHSL